MDFMFVFNLTFKLFKKKVLLLTYILTLSILFFIQCIVSIASIPLWVEGHRKEFPVSVCNGFLWQGQCQKTWWSSLEGSCPEWWVWPGYHQCTVLPPTTSGYWSHTTRKTSLHWDGWCHESSSPKLVLQNQNWNQPQYIITNMI